MRRTRTKPTSGRLDDAVRIRLWGRNGGPALAFFLALAVWFDLQEGVLIYTHGWPPDKFAHFGNDGFSIPTVTTRDRVVYCLILLGIGLVQVVLVRLAWKAWRLGRMRPGPWGLTRGLTPGQTPRTPRIAEIAHRELIR